MNRRSLLQGLVGAPLAAATSNVIPFPVPAQSAPIDATLTALAALSYTSQRVLVSYTGGGTFSWADVGAPERW